MNTCSPSAAVFEFVFKALTITSTSTLFCASKADVLAPRPTLLHFKPPSPYHSVLSPKPVQPVGNAFWKSPEKNGNVLPVGWLPNKASTTANLATLLLLPN